MVGPRSWQLLDMLELKAEDQTKWLAEHPSKWEENEGFLRFQDFITRLDVLMMLGKEESS